MMDALQIIGVKFYEMITLYASDVQIKIVDNLSQNGLES